MVQMSEEGVWAMAQMFPKSVCLVAQTTLILDVCGTKLTSSFVVCPIARKRVEKKSKKIQMLIFYFQK